MNSPPSPTAAGFTIVELLVVMVIIGLVLSLTIPRLSNPGRSAQFAAMQLAALMNDASTLARTNEEVVSVKYDPQQRTFSLEKLIPPSTPYALDGSITPIRGAPRVLIPPDVIVAELPTTRTALPLYVQSFNLLGRMTSGYNVLSFGTEATQAAVTPDAVVQLKPDGAQAQVSP